MVNGVNILAIKTVIPFFGIDRQYQNLREEIMDVTDRVYTSGQVLDGAYTMEFEIAMAQRTGRQHGIAVNSCTQGLIMAMQTMMTPESQVLIPNISFAATVNSVIMAGHVPVFCDTDDQALIDLESMDYSLKGAGIRTIMYANLFGNVVDYDRFRMIAGFFNNDDNLRIIEDAAQSFGASYNGIPSGKLGDVSVLSFDPTKNLPNFGSGGMILTDDLGWAEEFYDRRNNGKHHDHNFAGTNSKMSESDCAQMLVKLRHFDAWQDRRREIAEYYTGELRDYVDVPVVADGVVHAWHKYVIRLSERHGLQTALSQEGIETRFHYTQTLAELPVSWKYDGFRHEQHRHSTAFTRECMSLPIYPEMTDGEIEQVVDAIQVYLR